MLVFLLIQVKMDISFGQSCCNNDDKNSKIIMNADEDYGWNFEFTINSFPLQTITNLITIKQDSKSEITIMILKSEIGYQYNFQTNENHQFQPLKDVQLGVFYQIFLQSNENNLEFEWYSDFKITQKHSFLILESHQTQIIYNYELLCSQQIRNIDKHMFIKDCERQFHIQIQLYPQLKYIRSQQFNNNYYSLQFWVKQIQNQSNNNMNLYIQHEDQQGEFFLVALYNNKVNLIHNNNLIHVDQYDQNGWMFFQLTYQLNQRTLQYKRQEYIQNISLQQSFSQNYRLYIWPYKNIIFTAVQLHLTYQNNIILCVPGCLSCDEQGYCLQCHEDYLQIGNFCECKENLQFIFLPSECYIKLDYQVLQKNRKNIHCPQFGGQQCPQCEDDTNQNFRYCLYLTNIQLQFKQLELEDNYYHLFVSYNAEDNPYIPENTNNQNYQQFSYTNIIYLSEKSYDFYQIGFTVNNEKQCYNGYYYQISCRQIMKQCRIQEELKNCRVCHQSYGLINGKCSKCPKKCQYCEINQNSLICLKCQKGYFLNFQRKCIQCNLEYCEQCYHYNEQLNTLERNFIVQKLSFTYYLGCSYCENNNPLILDERVCIQVQDYQKTFKISEKIFIFDFKLFGQYLNRNCGQSINQCVICQNAICLLCNYNYLLNVYNNQCIQKYYNYTIYNQNLKIQDHDSQFNLITFLYFNYNYTDIIVQQKQFYLKDCQFNNYGKLQRIESISCFSELNYLINNNQCSFYCNSCLNNMTCLDYKYILKFQISFTISSQYNNTYLNNSNNFIFDFNSVHYLENNQHQLIIFINKISSSLIQFFLEIYYSTSKSQISLLIQFNNTNFQIDDYLTLNKPTIIQNSNLHIYKSLCVCHNSTNKEATFKIINSSFIGQSNQSYLLFNLSKLQKIEIENLVISNLQAFIFFAQAKTIYISNLTLINLNVRNQIQNCFMLQSDSLIIEKLQLINCSIQDNTFFEILSFNINIVNLKIIFTKFQNSTFMRINGQMKANIQIQNLFMIKLELYNSKVFIAEYNCFTINLFDLLVEQALSIDSYFIKLQRFYTILINNLSFLDSQLTNTCLIFVRSNIIYSQNIMIQRNSISSIEGIPSLCYEGEKINIIGLQYQQIHFKVFSILQILSNIIFINNLKLFNIRSELQMLNFRTYAVIIINCQEIKIKNLELYDIQTQTNLILFQVFNLHLDNLKASAITIIDHQKQINIILFYATLKLEIQVISINDIFITSESNQLIHRLFFITSSNIILFNSLIQNLNCQKAIIFSISANTYIKLTKLQATNVHACTLLDTQSDFNIITQLNFDQVEFTRNIVNYEPQNIQCYLLLTNLNITSSYLNMGIIQIFSQAYYKSFIEVKQISAQNIQSTTLINIQLAFSITSIKNIRIIKSNLEGILFNICKYQLLTISNIIVKKVNFQDSSQYAIHIFSSEIYLTQLLVDYCQNFAFLINSNDFKIEKLIFSNSGIRYLFFYQNVDKQNECNKSIFRNIYLANNIQILDYQVPEIIYFAFYQKQHFIQGLSMLNNTSSQKVYLVGFRGKFILQILLIDNNCQIHCLIIDPNSIILLRYQSDQINYLEKHQCLIGNTSKLIYNENYKQSKNIQITIQINSKIQIDNLKLLYIPSGQKLIRYKLYDFFNLKLDDYINQIKIIQYKDYKIYTILGSFMINIYEYNKREQKVLRNLSQYQNLQIFQQTEIQSGLEQHIFQYQIECQNQISYIILIPCFYCEGFLIIFFVLGIYFCDDLLFFLRIIYFLIILLFTIILLQACQFELKYSQDLKELSNDIQRQILQLLEYGLNIMHFIQILVYKMQSTKSLEDNWMHVKQ